MSREIPLTQGYVAVVDDEDYPELSRYNWWIVRSKKHVYAARHEGRKTVLMHRQIMSAPDGVDIDHANHGALDNRRCNLREATRSQNMGNAVRVVKRTSEFKGVDYRASRHRFRARIQRTFLGHFKTAVEAARAYNEAAIKVYGEFACLNVI